MGHVEQRREHSDGHEKRIHDQGAGKTKEFAHNKFPPPYRARQNGIERALLNLFGDQANPDEDRDHHSE